MHVNKDGHKDLPKHQNGPFKNFCHYFSLEPKNLKISKT